MATVPLARLGGVLQDMVARQARVLERETARGWAHRVLQSSLAIAPQRSGAYRASLGFSNGQAAPGSQPAGKGPFQPPTRAEADAAATAFAGRAAFGPGAPYAAQVEARHKVMARTHSATSATMPQILAAAASAASKEKP